MSRFANQYKNVLKETGSKVGYFAGFCHHPVTTTSTHTHAYHYPLFEKQIREQLLYAGKIQNYNL